MPMTKQTIKKMKKMAKYNFIFLIFACLLLLKFSILAQNKPLAKCGFMNYQKTEGFKISQSKFHQKICSKIAESKNKRIAIEEVIRIPVVVHVIHKNVSGTIGGATNTNISEAQIESQIKVLNEDYRRKPGTLGFNNNPLGADMQIEFFLAKTDPSGKPTNGITRTYSSKSSFDLDSDNGGKQVRDIIYWPTDSYLNIYVLTLDNDNLGFGTFPAAPNFDGLNETSDETVDGLYIDYRNFGKKIGTNNRFEYSYGRTVTHEIGHWLGLIHTWGDDFCGNDYCEDTPPAENSNLTVVCREVFSNCNGIRTKNMIENYMDYTIDSCMNTFTIDQKARTRAVFELSPLRKRLIQNVASLPESPTLITKIYDNPITNFLSGEILVAGVQKEIKITVINQYGQEITSNSFINRPSLKFSINVSNMANGLYYMKVTTDKEKKSTRFYKKGN